jgi:type VI secretion system protein ImpL
MSRKQIWITLGILLAYCALVWVLCWFFLRDTQWIPIALVFTACGITVAAVYWLVARMGNAKASADATPTAAAAPAPAKVAKVPEDRTVRELLNEAERQLASAPLLASERVRPKLANLPLYVLMGPEGSGKTSNFIHGDLSPVALAGQVFRNEAVIPTPAANLWYAQRALVVEPSGKWFTEGGTRWGGFLSALRGVRSGSAIKSLWQGPATNNLRGILLFLDASDFVGIPDTSRLAALARTVQDRLRAAASTFSADIPVWVVFSKADSIPFFSDYFARVHEVEDQQPLGCTLDLLPSNQRASMEVYAEAETQRLNERFDLLCSSLSQHRLPFLARESSAQVKRGIYEFPRELKQRVRGTVVQFLVEVFRPNALQPGPLLRGFYFTGIRQTPVAMGHGTKAIHNSGSSDATLLMQGAALAEHELKAALNMESGGARSERMVDRWCFVSQLLHQVVRPDQSGARFYGSQRAAMLRKLAFGTVIGLCALLCVGFLWSAWNNSRELSALRQAGVDLQGTSALGRDVSRRNLANLDAMRGRLVDLDQWEDSRPWRLGFLLYQAGGESGKDTVSQRAHATYERYFREYLLKPMLDGFTAEFAGLPRQESGMYPYERIYDHVKTYVSVTSHACPATPPLTDALMQGWQTWRTTGDDQAELVRKQFEFYVTELGRNRMPAIPVQPQALKSGQDYLNSFSEERRLYSQLIDEVSATVGAAKLSGYAPKYADVLTGVRDIPGAFTRAGWPEMQSRIAEAKPKQESCVLGTSAKERLQSVAGPGLGEKLQNLYLEDYARRWKEMLAAVQVRSYESARDAESKLGILDDDLTLLALMFMTFEHTESAKPAAPDATSKVTNVVTDVLKDAAAKRLEQSRTGRLAKQVAGALAPTDTLSANPDPATAFQPVRAMFSQESTRRNFNDTKNAPFTSALNGLRKAMRDLADSSNARNDVELNKTAKRAVDDGTDAVRGIARQFNNDAAEVGDQVSRLLNAPFDNARKHYVADPGKAGADSLNSAGRGFCTDLNPLLQMYPFLKSGREASLEDVARIFGPSGKLNAFYEDSLKPYLVKDQGRYTKTQAEPKDFKISQEFINSFNRLMRISDALFPNKTTQPSMQYRLTVLPNPDVRSVTVSIDGQQGGQERAAFNWPGSGTQAFSMKLRMADETALEVGYGGPWAIFSFMAEADPRPSGSREIGLSKLQHGERGLATPIIVKDKPITIRLHVDDFPGGVDTAFDSNFFSGARCVAKVAER